MQIVRTMKFRVYPTRDQAERIDATIDCCRFVYNHMLERNVKAYKRRGEHMAGYDMELLLPSMKKRMPWLKAADSTALKSSCKNLDRAFGAFYKKRSGHPRFKRKRDRSQGYRTTCKQAITFEPKRVHLLKVGWLKHRDNRTPRGEICEAYVSRELGNYYVSLTYKAQIEPCKVDAVRCIGLDYKSNGLYVDSSGNQAEMPRYWRRGETKIAKEQRRLARKRGSRKGEPPSNNYLKQLSKVQKRHRHIANQRKDFLHKRSTEIANQYDLVAVEDLNLKAISKAYRLGKSTLDNGYGMFLEMLEYKLEERGKTFVKVGRFFPSSQTCSCCGYKNNLTRDLSVREWVCPECGVVHDRDVNAAINILNEGRKITA